MKRHVSIGLTPWAPGCGAAAIGDRRRWITLRSVLPARAVADLCDRLRRTPAQLTARQALTPIGPDESSELEVEILGHIPGEAEPVVLAIVAYGLTLSEITAALGGFAAGRVAA